MENKDADIILIQPFDERDQDGIERELKYISDNTDADFRFIPIKIKKWNSELSPWNAPPVFGKDGFGNGAADTLEKIKELCDDKNRSYYLGGYSLAGLFALWAGYKTDLFKGIVAASPSLWFPGFDDYMKDNILHSKAVYLSLGDKEEKTKNPVMATVGNKVREAYEYYKEQGIDCILEWNQGNHFKDADIRTAKAFTWLLNRRK